MTDQNVPPQNPYPQGPGPQGYPPPPGGAIGDELSPADQRMWAMLAHLGGILFGFLAPLIIWLVQKDRGLYVAEQAREALNFQITVLIGFVVGFVLTFVFIGVFVLIVLPIVVLVFSILAGLAANRGENYRYPFAIRLVS